VKKCGWVGGYVVGWRVVNFNVNRLAFQYYHGDTRIQPIAPLVSKNMVVYHTAMTLLKLLMNINEL